MQLFNILSKLLDYPDDELMANLDSLIKIIKKTENITKNERKTLIDFIMWMKTHSSIEMQQLYVETFDMNPEHDLHFTHHIFGDNSVRGPALIDLSEHFKNDGLEVKDGEIPDYFPLILEYVSTLTELEARVFLGHIKKVIKVLADNLAKAKSPYAKLFKIIEMHSNLTEAA